MTATERQLSLFIEGISWMDIAPDPSHAMTHIEEVWKHLRHGVLNAEEAESFLLRARSEYNRQYAAKKAHR